MNLKDRLLEIIGSVVQQRAARASERHSDYSLYLQGYLAGLNESLDLFRQVLPAVDSWDGYELPNPKDVQCDMYSLPIIWKVSATPISSADTSPMSIGCSVLTFRKWYGKQLSWELQKQVLTPP